MVSSEGPSKKLNPEFQRATVVSGADLHLWNLKDVMKLFSDLQTSKLNIIEVNEKIT